MLKWNDHRGGARWRYLQDGRLVFEDGMAAASPDFQKHLTLDAEGAVRTRGEPKTALTLNREHGVDMVAAGALFGLPVAVIASVCLCESGRMANSLSRDPVSIRFEPGYISDEDTPRKVSAGLMQTLLATGREMCGAAAASWAPINAITGKPRLLTRRDLYLPDVSILLGAAYLRHQARRYKTQDLLLLHAAYNCGGVYTVSKTALRLKAYGGDDRFIKGAAYHNDWLAAGGAR
jgi:hypothetical protein